MALMFWKVLFFSQNCRRNEQMQGEGQNDPFLMIPLFKEDVTMWWYSNLIEFQIFFLVSYKIWEQNSLTAMLESPVSLFLKIHSRRLDKSSTCFYCSGSMFKQVRYTLTIYWHTYSFFSKSSLIYANIYLSVHAQLHLRWSYNHLISPHFSIISFIIENFDWLLTRWQISIAC